MLPCLGQPVARLAAGLLEQADLAEAHAAVDRLAHVVDGQQADADGGQRLHLDPRAAARARGDLAGDGVAPLVDGELDFDVGQRQRMAEGYQVGRALGGLDGGDAGDAEDVALAGATRLDQGQRGRQHVDGPCRTCKALGLGLVADVHHVGLSGGVEVGQW